MAPAQLIVVDNSTGAETHALCADRHDLTYIDQRGKQGVAGARQTALRAASCDIVAWTDDDARPTPQWIENLLPYFADPTVGAVGGPQILVKSQNANTDELVGVLRDGRVIGNFTYLPSSPLLVEHLIGVNMAFRREAAILQGGFDPFFVIQTEDTAVTYAFHAAGFRVVYAPDVIVHHDAAPRPRTDGRRFGYRYAYRGARSEAYFFVRQFGFRSAQSQAHLFGRTGAELSALTTVVLGELRDNKGITRHSVTSMLHCALSISGRMAGAARAVTRR
jgi:GT2 family glycosyltransferase